MAEPETKEQIIAEYQKHAHAMQSGVAMLMEKNPSHTTTKSLRVGVNSALCDVGGLAKLLLDKGVFTELEYFAAIRDSMKAEHERYEAEVNAAYPGSDIKITLA